MHTPVVEELILAGPTRELAMELFSLEVAYEEQQNVFRHIRRGDPCIFGAIRVCPPLKVAKRFRAFVTWVPVSN